MPKKDPALKVTMRSIVGKDTKSEENEAAGSAGEENTTDDPPSEEDNAESTESPESDKDGEDDAEGAADEDAEGESSEDDSTGEQLEFYVDGEEHPAPEAKDDRAFAKYRKTLRDKDLKIAELENKLRSQSQPMGSGVPDPGPAPTEEDEDVNYDAKKLLEKHAKWIHATAARKTWEAEQAQKVESDRQSVQQIMDSYRSTKASFAKMVQGYDEAEKAFNTLFDPQRQDALFRNCKNPAKVIYVLHRHHPELMERLSKSTNRDEIVRELVKLEATVKERKTGTPPAPGRRISGNAGTSQGEDPKLARLRKQAEKDGNMKPVTDYQRERKIAREKAARKG